MGFGYLSLASWFERSTSSGGCNCSITRLECPTIINHSAFHVINCTQHKVLYHNIETWIASYVCCQYHKIIVMFVIMFTLPKHRYWKCWCMLVDWFLFFIYMFLFVQGLNSSKIHRLEISRKVKSVVYIYSTLDYRYVLLLNIVFASLCNQYVISDLLFLHRTYYNAAWTFFNSAIVLHSFTYDFMLWRNLWTVKCSPH